jgi:hypothetical protein
MKLKTIYPLNLTNENSKINPMPPHPCLPAGRLCLSPKRECRNDEGREILPAPSRWESRLLFIVTKSQRGGGKRLTEDKNACLRERILVSIIHQEVVGGE